MRPVPASITVLLLTVLSVATAQPYRVMVYPGHDVNSGVSTSATRSPDGVLWFGSTGAVIAYDGSVYRYFRHDPNDSTSLTYGDIMQLVYDPRGAIWAGSEEGGLSRLDLTTGKCFTYFHSHGNDSTITGNSISGLAVDRAGNVWAATDNFGLTRIDTAGRTTAFHPPLPPGKGSYEEAGSLQEVVEDTRRDGHFWLSSGYGLYRFKEAHGTFELIMPSFEDRQVAGGFSDIVQDKRGRVWCAAPNEGIWCHDPATLSWKQFKAVVGKQESFRTNRIMELICTYHNKIVGSSTDEGYWVIDAYTDSLSIFQPPETISAADYNNTRIIVEDDKGDLWTGRRSLLRFTERRPPFRHFKFSNVREHLGGNWQRTYLEDPVTGNFFVGTYRGDGLLEANLKSQSVIPHYYLARPDNNLIDADMRELTLAGDSGVWIGSTSGLLYYDRQSGKINAVRARDSGFNRIAGATICCIDVDTDGDVWIGTARFGLIRWNPNTGKSKAFVGTRSETSGDLKEMRRDPDGQIWLLHEHDVVILNPLSGRSVFLPKKTRNTAGLFGRSFHDIELDNEGDAWISASGGGLNRVSNASGASLSVRYYGTAEGLPSNEVHEIVIAHDGRIWAGTDKGIAVLDPATGHVASYRAADGLGFDGRGGPLYQLSTGEVLSGGRGGFHYVHPDSLRETSSVPRPYLYQLETANGVELLMFIKAKRLRIGPYDNFFSVTWGSISFDESPVTRYEYMLEGYDDGWIMAGDRTYARYGKLPGGRYTFRLRAVNDRGQRSEELAALRVRVVPPFMRTTLFYVLVAAIAMVLMYAFYRVRVKRIRGEAALKTRFEQELAQMEMHALRAQMNPHFLFNSLNSINQFIIDNDSRSASKYLARFSRLIRLILDNSKSKKVTLANELEAIRIYVELESLRFDNRFDFEMRVATDVEQDNVEIDSMILQPYIENAIWHGLMHKKEKGLLTLDLKREKDTLVCVVEDNGVGRNRAAELKSKSAITNKSLGMKITSDRIRMLNTNSVGNDYVDVIDLKGPNGEATGTRVIIKLPI